MTRPLLLHGVACPTKHGNHAHAEPLPLNRPWGWRLRFIFRDRIKTKEPDTFFVPRYALVNCPEAGLGSPRML